MRHCLAILLIVAAPAFAECPATPDISDEMEALIEEVRAAPNEMAARDVSARMWELWLTAPDETAQDVLDRGMRRRVSYDFLGAVEEFTRLIEYCPDYAEGYNQRAFVYFLSEDYEKALVDLDAALARSPEHVGALSGRALTLLGLNRLDEARLQLIEALDINPWLSERYMMLDGGPLAPRGKDI